MNDLERTFKRGLGKMIVMTISLDSAEIVCIHCKPEVVLLNPDLLGSNPLDQKETPYFVFLISLIDLVLASG